jgi:hypothetical protein
MRKPIVAMQESARMRVAPGVRDRPQLTGAIAAGNG